MRSYKKRGLAFIAASVSAVTLVGAPVSVYANANNGHTGSHMASNYTAHLEQLNNAGVSGKAHLNWQQHGDGDRLNVNLHVNGTTPGQTHPVHIHGKEHPEVAFCPTNEVDTNKDGFVSVIEGAATYGPIKLNLTSPQTPFGTPPTPALFTPFAGTPDPANFPKADANGMFQQNETYHFDHSEAARGALETLKPLENQHIVVHGAMAPASVDADAFAALGLPVSEDPNAVIYDPLLPVACGEIEKHGNDQQVNNQGGRGAEHNNADQGGQGAEQHNNNQNNQGQNQNAGAHATSNDEAVAQFHARMEVLHQEYQQAHANAKARFETERANNHGEARDHFVNAVQAAHDRHMNQFHEARNHFVDQMNQGGHVQQRDEVMHEAEKKAHAFSKEFEAMKHEFVQKH